MAFPLAVFVLTPGHAWHYTLTQGHLPPGLTVNRRARCLGYGVWRSR